MDGEKFDTQLEIKRLNEYAEHLEKKNYILGKQNTQLISDRVNPPVVNNVMQANEILKPLEKIKEDVRFVGNLVCCCIFLLSGIAIYVLTRLK